MERGREFLKDQINNAVAQHLGLLKSLEDHVKQADDPRFRDLCSRHILPMQRHQGMLEAYQSSIGAGQGTAKKAMSMLANAGRDLVDAAREHDFLRLVADIVMARQAEDTFKTFREAGKALGDRALEELGDQSERDMDVYVKEANSLVQQMFVECARELPVGTTA